MERVNGIGGIFFKARNPAKLAAWYQEHLGFSTSDSNTEFQWLDKKHPEQVGRTVWSLFPEDSDYFGPKEARFMVNYRVSNLDEMLAHLISKGVVVEKTESYDYGRFAWLADPEGNRIELWEPACNAQSD